MNFYEEKDHQFLDIISPLIKLGSMFSCTGIFTSQLQPSPHLWQKLNHSPFDADCGRPHHDQNHGLFNTAKIIILHKSDTSSKENRIHIQCHYFLHHIMINMDYWWCWFLI